MNVFGFTLQPELKETSDKIICMLINCEFALAQEITDSLMAADSTEPLYPFLHLCALGLRDLDFDRIIDTSAFLATYQKTVNTINYYEKIHGRTSYSMTLLGFAYATHSSFYLLHKKYFSAIGTGLDAVRIFNEAKKMDSTNYDADFFLGFYNYARGELKKRLWMVLFWYPGSKEQGIKSLEACRINSQIVSEGAKMILIDVYVNESEYEKSEILADSLFKKYPHSRFLLWSRAKYFEKLKEYAKAAKEYEKLAEAYANVKYGEYNSLITRDRQIKLMIKSGQNKEAVLIAQKVLDCDMCTRNKLNKDVCKDIKRHIKE